MTAWKDLLAKCLAIVPVTIPTQDMTKSLELQAVGFDVFKMFPILISYYAHSSLGTAGPVIVQCLLFVTVMFAIFARQDGAIMPVFITLLLFSIFDYVGFIPMEVMPFIVLVALLVAAGFGYILFKKK